MSGVDVMRQEMRQCCIIILLSLQLSSLWSAVTGLQCYKCNSIETSSCAHAGSTDDWQTCHDENMCLTGIGVARPARDTRGPLILCNFNLE